MPRTYRITEGGLADRFLRSRAKIRVYGGGYANGKTSGSSILALQLAKDYPGSNGLMARATYPKLCDTLRKEFLKWCPNDWIKSFPRSQNSSNTCILTNGSEINFRYVAQQGKSSGDTTTSNLLSATYDWIIIDQIEDPEIVQKDFEDLLGRLRGSAPYVGDDPTMPETGPRWFIATCNPTRNWFFRTVIRPLHIYNKTGVRTDDLYWDDDENKPLVELFEGSTYTNRDNLAEDYIKTLERTYKGQMRDRFLLGKWAAYEGLVYWMFDEDEHVHPREHILEYLRDCVRRGIPLKWIEAYDHGLAKPSCYLFGMRDLFGNVFVLDGFYEAEQPINKSLSMIKEIRREWRLAFPSIKQNHGYGIYADPAAFRRTTGDKAMVGVTVNQIMWDDGNGVRLTRGNNSIQNGIVKVQTYLLPQPGHVNPITGAESAPFLYVARELEFWTSEITDYYWKKSPDGEYTDEPMDRNDHAMDATKYMLTDLARASEIEEPVVIPVPTIFQWHEMDTHVNSKAHRYG